MIASTPSFLLAQASGGGFAWGPLITSAVIQLVVAGITSVVAVRIAVAVLAKRTDQLERRQDRHDDEIASIGEARHACELKAVKTYSTKDHFTRLLVDAAANHQQIVDRLDELGNRVRESVGKVHGRIDTLAERVTRVEERGL